MFPSLFGLPPPQYDKYPKYLQNASNLYALPSPVNMTNMIRQDTEFPPTPRSPSQTCPTANFGPLSRGSIIIPMLITVFDTYLTPRSPKAWV